MKHNAYTVLAALALILASLVTGCVRPAQAPDAAGGGTMDLDGTSWTLVDLPGREVLPEPAVTLDFADGQVKGSAGCNSYFGAYQADGEQLTVGTIGMTEMYCVTPEGVMEQEQGYLKALGAAAGYRIEGDRLTVLGSGGERLLEYVVAEA